MAMAMAWLATGADELMSVWGIFVSATDLPTSIEAESSMAW